MFRNTHRGELELLHSDEADVYLQGAQLTRFRDWLYLAPHAQFAAGRSIRGGVPICFPWFGPKTGDPDAPQHGVARTALWDVENVADDAVTLALTTEDWRARMTYGLGDELRMRFEIENLSYVPLPFECALHTYYAVDDVRNVAVRGLDGKTYLDKPADYARKVQSGDVTFGDETDRVYLDAPGPIEIRDERRTLVINGAAGWRSTVVWNPGREVAAKMKDLGADEWTRFVCVECGAIADDAITLAPSDSYVLEFAVSVS